LGIGGRKSDFQFCGRDLQGGIGSGERYDRTGSEMFLELPGLEAVFAQFDCVVAGIDGGDGECAIRLNCANGNLIDENCGSWCSALDVQRG